MIFFEKHNKKYLDNKSKLQNINFKSREKYKNSTLYWHGSDSENKFYKFKRKNINHPKIDYYKKNPILYNFNNFGFRTYDNFSLNEKGIVILGCSFSEGVGIPIEELWGYKLSKTLNKKFWNLSIGGSGIRSCFENLIIYDSYLEYDDVFLLIPPKFRKKFYIFDNDLIKSILKSEFSDIDFLEILPTMLRGDTFISKDYEKWISTLLLGSNFEEFIYEISYLYAIIGFCKDRNKNIYFTTVDHINDLFEESKNNFNYFEMDARDGHWGFKKQHFTYEYFLKQINNDI